jgi:signal peptidase I
LIGEIFVTTKRDVDGDNGPRGWLRTILLTLAIVLVPRVVLCQPFTIPSGSMEPTLQVGDYILVSKYPYGWSRHSIPLSPPLPQGRLLGQAPARGDIVVFKKPNDGRTDVIKRLIGLPGDKVQVVEGVLRINDRPVRRELVGSSVEAPFGEMIPVGQFKETLPGGRDLCHQQLGLGHAGRQHRSLHRAQGLLLRDGRQSRQQPGQPLRRRDDPQGAVSLRLGQRAGRLSAAGAGHGLRAGRRPGGPRRAGGGVDEPGASVLEPWTLVSHMRWDRTFKRLGV